MLALYYREQGSLRHTIVEGAQKDLPENTIWIDLLNPLRSDELAVERMLGVEVPSREEMQEIEASSRLYVEGKALIMTLPIVNRAGTDEPETTAVTFILAGNCLVTLRYADPTPFSQFIQRMGRQPGIVSGEQVLIGLLEHVADRSADILETATNDLDNLSRNIFRASEAPKGTIDFRDVLRRIGHIDELASRARDSLLNFNRLLLFLTAQADMKKENKARVKTMIDDVKSIDEHAIFLLGKVSFLLDATLGLINIEQNNIIKIFSVAAVTFLPPTLVASAYGMNFKYMPELDWLLGYPLAVVLMVLSAAIPFWYFRRKKWM